MIVGAMFEGESINIEHTDLGLQGNDIYLSSWSLPNGLVFFTAHSSKKPCIAAERLAEDIAQLHKVGIELDLESIK